jgi:hypothetical protein
MYSFHDSEQVALQWSLLVSRNEIPFVVGVLLDNFPELALKLYHELSKEYT